jgi:hypothetical protein
MNKKIGLSRRLQRTLFSLIYADLTAIQAALVGGFNRNTANRYCRIFGEAIRDHQRAFRDRLTGTVEVGASCFGAPRKRGDPGMKRRARVGEATRLRHLRTRPAGVHRGRAGLQKDYISIPDHLQGCLGSGHHVGWMGGRDGLVDVGHDAHFRIKNAPRKAHGPRPSSTATPTSTASRASGPSPNGGWRSSKEPGQTSSFILRNVTRAGAKTAIRSSLNSPPCWSRARWNTGKVVSYWGVKKNPAHWGRIKALVDQFELAQKRGWASRP